MKAAIRRPKAGWALILCCLASGLFAQDAWLGEGRAAPPVWNGQTDLPPGLHAVQLQGRLVCPPVRMPGHGVLVAADDRTVKLIGEDGRIAWSLEMDRLIRGPLAPMSASMALVALSGEQVAAFRMDGRKVWQQRIESSAQSWFLGMPDGRLVQIFQDGRIRYCHPDGSTLFWLNAGARISGLPKLQEEGLLCVLADGRQSLLTPAGNLRPLAARAPTASDAAAPADAPAGGLRFNAEKNGAGGYTIHVRSLAGTLDFSSKGELGHWIVDNRAPALIVWGDSLWRCFLYQADEISRPAGGQAKPASPLAGGARYGFKNLFVGLEPQAKLELTYLQALYHDDPTQGGSRLVSHVGGALKQGKLAGKLQFYEDVLAWLLEEASLATPPDISLMVACVDAMGEFPSLRHLPRLAPVFGRVPDLALQTALLRFMARLGSDPDGLMLAAVDASLPRWLDQGQIKAVQAPLKAFIAACSASWPDSAEARRLRAASGLIPQ